MTEPPEPAAFLLRRSELESRPLSRFVHQHNPRAVRYTSSLTDPLGFTDMGVHLVRLRRGDLSSEHHFHEEDEEFVYVISGHGVAFIGDEQFDVEAGDFMAFPKGSPPHHMRNDTNEDLVYLVGGTRAEIDVCNYPRRGLRQYRLHGRREFVASKDLQKIG